MSLPARVRALDPPAGASATSAGAHAVPSSPSHGHLPCHPPRMAASHASVHLIRCRPLCRHVDRHHVRDRIRQREDGLRTAERRRAGRTVAGRQHRPCAHHRRALELRRAACSLQEGVRQRFDIRGARPRCACVRTWRMQQQSTSCACGSLWVAGMRERGVSRCVGSPSSTKPISRRSRRSSQW
jgi:hypothetical protein